MSLLTISETSVQSFDTGVVAITATGNATLYTATLLGLPFIISAAFTNLDASNAWDQFVVEAQLVEGGDWFTYITDAQIGTGTAIANVLRSVSTDLGALAALASGLLSIEGAGLYAIRFRVSKATADGTGQAKGFIVQRP